MFTPCSRLLVQKDTLFKMQVKLYTLFMTQGSENHTLFGCTCPFSPNKWLPHSPTPHLRFSLTFLAQCPLFSLHGNLAITSEKLSCPIRALCNLEISFFSTAFTGTFQGVIDVLCEWGSLFVITMENKVPVYLLTNEKSVCCAFPHWSSCTWLSGHHFSNPQTPQMSKMRSYDRCVILFFFHF